MILTSKLKKEVILNFTYETSSAVNYVINAFRNKFVINVCINYQTVLLSKITCQTVCIIKRLYEGYLIQNYHNVKIAPKHCR